MRDLNKQFQIELSKKAAIGESRHDGKINGVADQKIYSIKTMDKYREVAHDFARYCQEQGIDRMNKAKPLADQYLQSLKDRGLSAWTQQTSRSALHKLYGEQFTTVQLDQKHRSEITRSRLDTASSRHFSEAKNASLVNFLQHTGLRRMEAESLKPEQLHYQNGQAYLTIKGKGGKIREVPILNNDKATIEKIENTEPNKEVWGRIHSKCNVHGYRADYAREMYQSIARDIDTLEHREIYYCRADMAGLRLDREAMRTVSEALGHNRIDVIANNYLYTL